MKILAVLFLGLIIYNNAFSCTNEELDSKVNFEKCQKEAKLGDLNSQRILGRMYREEDTLWLDHKKSAYWFQKASDQGDTISRFMLCHAYLAGIGVKQDYQRALSLCRDVAEHGSTYTSINAQLEMGYIYSDNEGIKPDIEKAIYWFSVAGENGETRAMGKLAEMYYFSEGVEQDVKKAIYWWNKAADKGDSFAQLKLGALYYAGEFVRQDMKKSKEWYGKACDNGEKVGCIMYRDIN